MNQPAQQGARVLPTIILTVFLDMLGVTLIIPILAPLLIESNDLLGPSVAENTRNLLYGLVIGMFSLFQFVGAPMLGAASDKYGRKPVLYLTLSGTLLAYLVIAASIWLSSLPLLLLGRAIQGFSAGNLSVIYSAIADVSRPEDKAKNFGLVGAAFGLGFVIGPVMGGVLSDSELVSWFSFVTPFLVSAILVVVNIVMVRLLFRETNLHPQPGMTITLSTNIDNLQRAFSNPALSSIFMVVFFVVFGFTFFTQFIQVFLIRKFDFGQSDIGYIFGYIGFVIVLTQGLLVRYLSGRAAPAAILRICLLALSIAFLLLLIPDKAWGLYVLMPLVAINQGLINPNLTATVSNLAPPEIQGQTLGMQQSVQSLAQMLPPFLGGAVLSYSLSSPLWLASASMLMAWVLFMARSRGPVNAPKN